MQEKYLLEDIEERSDFITLEVKLVGWDFTDFTMVVRTCTALTSIARRIREQHGRTNYLQLFTSAVNAKNQIEIEDFTQTLERVGAPLGVRREDADNIRFELFYDFKNSFDDPLLLHCAPSRRG
jgi:hypothetical protein